MSGGSEEFSLERFESLAHGRFHKDALIELLKLLHLLNSRGGGYRNVGLMVSDQHAANDHDAQIAGRIASALTSLFADPQFLLGEADFLELIPYQRWLAVIFGASSFGTADHIINILNQYGHGEEGQLVNNGLKACLLHFADSHISLQPESLWKQNKRIAASMFLAILSSRIVATQEAHSTREQLLDWLPEQLGELALDELPIEILNDVWMHCSYAEGSAKHAIKAPINEMIRVKLRSAGFSDLESHFTTPRSKPVAVCILEGFHANHPMFRTHSLSLEALRARFHLIGVSLRAQFDEYTRRIFDEFVVVPGTHGILDAVLLVTQLAKSSRPELVYYPCVGMLSETIFLVNLRLAPIQMVATGHPATTHSQLVDYMLVEEDYLGSPERFRETLVALPKDCNPYRPRADDPLLKPTADATSGPVRIAIAASIMKINVRFLETLREIRMGSQVAIEYHFLPGGAFGLAKSYLQRLIRRVLPDCAVVYPHLEYTDYLGVINRCQMFLNPFPYGNTNGIVDTIRQGLPGVCLTGPEVHSHIDEGLFRRLKLPEELIANSIESYVGAAKRLIENDVYRRELRRNILDSEPDLLLFRGNTSLFVDAVAYICDNHAQLKLAGTRVVKPPVKSRTAHSVT